MTRIKRQTTVIDTISFKTMFVQELDSHQEPITRLLILTIKPMWCSKWTKRVRRPLFSPFEFNFFAKSAY